MNKYTVHIVCTHDGYEWTTFTEEITADTMADLSSQIGILLQGFDLITLTVHSVTRYSE